jgi:hypothetical protein
MNGRWAAAAALLGQSVGIWAASGRGDDRGEMPVAAPEFTGITDWINSKPLKLADQKGKVVIIHFWTNGCINCIHNYPHYRAWQERYETRGIGSNSRTPMTAATRAKIHPSRRNCSHR